MDKDTSRKDTSRIIAVRENDIDLLIELSDTSEWYKLIEEDTDNTLLHIAALHRSKDVFNFLVSIEDFPLDHRNDKDKTVLNLCFERRHLDYDQFACQLIKKGANLDCIFLEFNNTLLHYTARRGFPETSKLLMSMGFDVNAQTRKGLTPLWLCLNRGLVKYFHEKKETEIVTALLCYGADPEVGKMLTPGKRYDAFEHAVVYNASHTLQEALFLFMMDRHSLMHIHLEVLLILADKRSPLFYDVVKLAKDVLFSIHSLYSELLFSIDVTYLNLLIKKYPDEICQTLDMLIWEGPIKNELSQEALMKNVNCILQSDLRDMFIEYVERHNYLSRFLHNERLALERVCLFLSYGVDLCESHLIAFYNVFGFGEMIQILLHMDTKLDFPYIIKPPFLLLLSDVQCDLQQILQRFDPYCLKHLRVLLHFFADAKLRALCIQDQKPEVVAIIKNQPDVPRLIELSRNVFRKHFVRTFSIKSSRQYYTLLNKLPVPSVCKKIITMQRKLY